MGPAANALARLGIAGIVVEGTPPDDTLRCLVIGPDEARLEEAGDLKGLGNYDTVAKLQEHASGAISCISIGPAGELKLSETDDWVRPSVGGVILEIKFTDRFPVWLREMVRVFNLERRSMAKYVVCARQLVRLGVQLGRTVLPGREEART